MKGHERIVEARRAGRAPALVFVDVSRDLFNGPDSAWPTVQIDPADPLRRLDLRFLVGLRVVVQGDDVARVGDVFEAVKAAGADHVLGHAHRVSRFGAETVQTWNSWGAHGANA